MSTFDLDRIGGAQPWSDFVSEVLAAGEMALHMQRTAGVMKKSDASPVTEADHEVERRLRTYIERVWPKASILGEESGVKDDSEIMRFIIDPIDGTRAFIRGLPTWSVLVGLQWHGRVVAGIALLPTDGDLFTAIEGEGAYMNGRPCKVSTTDTLDESLVMFGGLRQFTESGKEDALLRVAKASYTTRAFADFANYRELLQGRVDAVVDPGITPWDIAPASILVREAGGRFSDWSGTDTIEGDAFVASNGRVHGELLALL